MTEPLGTVVLDCIVIAPTVSVAPVIAVVAAVCVNPTTFGTVVCGRPDETTSATEELINTSLSAVGVWLMTDPLGTVVLDCVVIAPTVSVAPVIAVLAAACVNPTTFGTVVCGRPDETTRATVVLIKTSVFATGV